MSRENPYAVPFDGPALDWVPIVPSATALAQPIRAIRANTDGTVTVTMKRTGASRTLNFIAGETRTLWATHVTAATATGLEGAI
ncbi:hypothetical protein [Bradyrhizobium sp. ERR14]|uniref:spike base protein, RCAP_Rcc01079 family n=1 Tax=Bradyrhizobium sp. ERR14 TaxID=2663837 RepID=UPI00161DF9A2|nr:hypothetical protein [Bradyrhizobium sp. ERR14]MBB4398762.1 hypothetical protein [Bradyrhizobium sp. ERR14]